MDTDNPRPPQAGHVPVLARQVLEVLAPGPGHVLLDCTIGRAGHAQLIAPRLGPTGRLIGLDVDPANVAYARERLQGTACRVDLVKSNFASARAVLDALGVPAADLLLADLGFASTQMADPQRGLSFDLEGPLDMRLDPELPQSAADLVNHLPETELANVIYRYGEERLSRRIARNIAERRRRQPILTTTALAEVVRRACGRCGGRIDPATRTFMALRIAVNAELEALSRLLADLPRLLTPGGAAAILSFHSLEDRLVKQAFVDLEKRAAARRLTKKVVRADDAELRTNPRSRSARLRALRMGATPVGPTPTP